MKDEINSLSVHAKCGNCNHVSIVTHGTYVSEEKMYHTVWHQVRIEWFCKNCKTTRDAQILF